MPLLRNMRVGWTARHTFRVNGTVIDALHHSPIAGARVEVSCQPKQPCYSGYDGAFAGVAVSTRQRQLSLCASAPGYRPATFEVRVGPAGGSAKLTLKLWPQQELAPGQR